MSASTRNPFSLLDEDYDPNAVNVAKAESKKEESTPKEILAKQTTSKKRDPTRQTAGESRRGDDSAPKSERSSKPRGPSNANEAFSKDKSLGHDANATRSTEDTATRGSARGRGRGRGSGTRREFDRRNATGKTDTAKATEQSWGNEAEAQQSASADPVDAHDPAAPETTATDAQAAAPPAEEEEDNTVSYQDYLKQKSEKASAVAALKPRVANEGADDSKWGSQELTKENQNDAYFAGVQKTKSSTQKERKLKETLEIEPMSYQAPASRGRGDGRGRGRGSRGAPRGGRGAGRGEGRAPSARPKSQGADLTLNDDTAFPSLS